MLSPVPAPIPHSSSPQPWPTIGEPKRGSPVVRILHLEDNDLDAALVRKLVLAEWPTCQLTRVATRFAYTGELHLRTFDVILSDFTLESFDGFEALALAQQWVPDTPFILLSGTVSDDIAIEAVRSGARDYVLKDQIQRLTVAIHRALKESEEHEKRRQAERYGRELAGFLNKAREAIVVIDLNGRITFWNQGAERLLGWSAAEVSTQTTDRAFGTAVADKLASGLKIATAQGEWVGELEVTTKAAGDRLMEFRISLINDDRGRPQARLAICTDLTEQKLAERRVREQAEMLDQAREAIIITDMQSRIIYWSAGAERIYGWQSDEAIGKTAEELFPQFKGIEWLRTARDVTRAQGDWHGLKQVVDRLGKPRMIEVRRTLIRDESGRGKAHLSIASDVTEQKRLEEQLLKVQRVETIGLIAAGIAHDLYNMLAPMLMATPVLRGAVTDPAALRLLEILEKSADRGAALIRQILAFSQDAVGEAQSVELRPLLGDIRMLMAETFPKTIKVVEQFAPVVWAVEANLSQLHQVLLNLCLNARDAMPTGGTLTLCVENCRLDRTTAAAIDGGRPGEFVLLRVDDTGTGIAPEVLARLWEPFVTTKRGGKGTGLGLSTVRGIVMHHRGFIQVESKPGQGTSFQVYLPAARTTDAPAHANAPSAPRGNGELILVVDDEEPIRDMIGDMLTRHGYRVLTASDGAEATAFFAKHANEIRLVVSDLNMPNLDGAMLSRVLKRMNPDVRVLVVSGMASPSEGRPDFRAGEFTGAFLHKPFKIESLLQKTSELLQRPAVVASRN